VLVDVIRKVWVAVEGREEYERRLGEAIELLEQGPAAEQAETPEQHRERRRAEIAERRRIAAERGGT
jgi:hypothetical protein